MYQVMETSLYTWETNHTKNHTSAQRTKLLHCALSNIAVTGVHTETIFFTQIGSRHHAAAQLSLTHFHALNRSATKHTPYSHITYQPKKTHYPLIPHLTQLSYTLSLSPLPLGPLSLLFRIHSSFQFLSFQPTGRSQYTTE